MTALDRMNVILASVIALWLLGCTVRGFEARHYTEWAGRVGIVHYQDDVVIVMTERNIHFLSGADYNGRLDLR